MKPLESFDWDGVGHLISGNEGIIEPIVQSILKCFFSIPEEIERLYERGFKENNINLLYRIYLALRTMTNYTDPKLAKIAEDYVEKFDKYFNSFMADFLSKDVEDSDERETLRLRLLSLRSKDQDEN
jgi:hypothetical protein